MRATKGPLLQVSKGPVAGASPRATKQRHGALLALVLVLLAASALLLVRQGSAGSGGGEAAGAGGSEEAAAQQQQAGSAGGVSTGGDPIAAAVAAAEQAEAEPLAAALKRARKAAALPQPEFRTHAAGLGLSPGAAAAAAACRGERCELLSRLLLAVDDVRVLAESGGCAVQHCPDALGVGLRPLPYTAHAMGNRCEPLWNRGALEVVRQLAAPDWRALEWTTGSSTAWLLSRVGHLTSVEAVPGFAAKARSVAASQFDAAFLEAHWDLRLAPPPAGSRVASFADLESEALFGGYCAADFLPEGTRFDLIAVQGFARVACLRRALALLRPQGGLLVLPQAQRPAYRNAAALVPDHWVRLTDAHQLGTTHVWVSLENP